MKAILEFDLEEPDDHMAHMRAVKAVDLCLVLWDLDMYLREQVKYHNKKSINIETLREKILDIKTAHGIVLDELIN